MLKTKMHRPTSVIMSIIAAASGSRTKTSRSDCSQKTEQRTHKDKNRHRQGNDLSENGGQRRGQAGVFAKTQNQKGRHDRCRRDQPNILRDPGIYPLSWSSSSTFVLRKWR